MEAVCLSANDFIQRFRPNIQIYGAKNIYNTDQSGFNIQLLSNRTLETKGSGKVEIRIEQQHSATHSYTIQPTISADGDLIAPLYIVLQETGGAFGPNVQRNIFRHDEVFASASSSGKVTKGHIKEWFLKVYFPNVGNKTLLVGDALNSYKDRTEINNAKPAHKEYTMEILPKGTTGMVQPLDIYFFRLYKAFTRRITDYMNMHHADVLMHLRNNILKLQTAVHFQFRSPRFKNCIKFAWHKSGYINESVNHIAPRQFCFDLDNIPDWTDCDRPAFIRCGWCKEYLCSEHFFISENFHYCNQFVE